MKSLQTINDIIEYVNKYHSAPLLDINKLLQVKQDLQMLYHTMHFRDYDLDNDIENLIIECNDNDKWNIPISKFTLFLIQDRLMRYQKTLEILSPVIHLDNNIEFGGDSYWFADDRQCHYIKEEDYYMIEEIMKNINK